MQDSRAIEDSTLFQSSIAVFRSLDGRIELALVKDIRGANDLGKSSLRDLVYLIL